MVAILILFWFLGLMAITLSIVFTKTETKDKVITIICFQLAYTIVELVSFWLIYRM